MYLSQLLFSNSSVRNVTTEQGLGRVQSPSLSESADCTVVSRAFLSVHHHKQMAGAGDLEEATVNCVDAWVAKLLDGKTLAESEVVHLCNKVSVSYAVTLHYCTTLTLLSILVAITVRRSTVRAGTPGK